MVPSSSDLSYFLEVAATGNISRAAERLGISQPSLSMAIMRLEDSLGTPLLVRNNTGVSLTKVGHRFQAKARTLVDQWQRIKHEVKRDEMEIVGCYKLGAHVSVSRGRLAQALPLILRQYPLLEIQMHHDLSRRIAEKVVNFELDFGIVVNPLEHPDLVITELYTDRVSFFGHRDLANDAVDNVLLCYDPDLVQSRMLMKSARERDIRFSRFILSSSLEVVASFIAQKAGLGILPYAVAKSYPTLIPFFPDIAPYEDIHTLVYRADSQSSPAAKTLARALVKTMKDKSP